MTRTDLESAYVGAEEAAGVPDALRELAGRSLRILTEPLEASLLDAIDAPEVLLAVIGARGEPADGDPVGARGRHLLAHTSKPIVVVPPGLRAPGPIASVLVPLEGSEESSRPILDALWPMIRTNVQVIVVHVFTEATLPRMLDRPVRDLDLLGQEFLTTHLPVAELIELRADPVAASIGDVAREQGSDLVVLSWGQNITTGRAQVVRDVLRATSLPVMLLPAAPLSIPAKSLGS
jgi:Universal stress protein family